MNILINDEVEFVDMPIKVKDYFYTENAGIPKEKIIHGMERLGGNYQKYKARVVDIWNEYYIVQWYSGDTEETKEEMRIGFKETSLRLINNSNNNSNDNNNNSKKNMLNTLTNKIKRFFNKEQRVLYRADYITECFDLTVEGKTELDAIVRAKFMEDLVKSAEEKKEK